MATHWTPEFRVLIRAMFGNADAATIAQLDRLAAIAGDRERARAARRPPGDLEAQLLQRLAELDLLRTLRTLGE